MSGYPQPPPGYGYGHPSSQPHSTPPYGSAPPSAPHVSSPPGPYDSSPYGPPHGSSPYGGSSTPYAPPPGEKPPKDKPGVGGAPPPGSSYPPASPYGSPFSALLPSVFPPGTDPSIVACFELADRDRSGFIDDKELQGALSSYNQSFSISTVHLLMYLFTNSNVRKIGPKEFTSLFYSLQSWRGNFERFDRDRSGKIDGNELRESLLSLGFALPPVVLDLLVTKFDKTGGRNKAIEYDNFIECCLIVKGLTEKFKEKDTSYSGSATFTFEAFMLAVLPFLVA